MESGGIGHAAIAICKEVGATIYVTALEDKQAIVRALGAEEVYDSASTAWFEQILDHKNGQGFDIVLNSLTGEHQLLLLQALRPGGRFLEVSGQQKQLAQAHFQNILQK